MAALPPGLRVTVLHRVVDLGDDRPVLRMEDVDIGPVPGIHRAPRGPGVCSAGWPPAASWEADDPLIVSASARGPAEGGADVPPGELVCGHHGSLLARAGFTAFPLEHLADPPTPSLHELLHRRAGPARCIADAALALEH